MSLVDYASSSEEEDEKFTGKRDGKRDEIGGDEEDGEKGGGREERILESAARVPPLDPLPNQHLVMLSSHRGVSSLPPSQIEKLPDASLLLSSSSFSPCQTAVADHASRVAVAIAARESQKRELTGTALAYPRRKLPRGSLLHSRNVPDTVGSQLIPPQLHGRSNVVTEDMSKLFVRKDGQNLPGRS